MAYKSNDLKILTHQLLRMVDVGLVWGGLVVAGGCQPDTTPATTAAGPLQPGAVVTTAAGSRARVATPVSDAPDSTANARPAASPRFVVRLDTLPPAAWSNVRRVELYESLEGGEAVFYYQQHALRKIVARYLGETYQQRTTFYLRSGQPTLVVEQDYHYNRPITYDSAAMRANADTEAFDLAKSTIQTTRSYFGRGRLRYQAVSPANDSAAYLLREQRRLADQLRRLLAQAAAEN
ncbi:hypothetical protein A0257_20160 [Hymenobacter psoromatis]|nr:hypothetical protein A0257_20160 [Hymenobacter psoromatis]